MKSLTAKRKELELNRANSARTTFQLGYEMKFALFLMVVGVLAVTSSSTEVSEQNGANDTKNRTREFIILISKTTIDLQVDDGKKIPCASLTDAVHKIMKAYSQLNLSSTSSRVVLAPTRDVFADVPAWYRQVRNNVSEKISVNVAIP